MIWFFTCVLAYLIMIAATRAVYEATIDEGDIQRWSWGSRKDEARILMPLFWPFGLPLLAGEFLGRVIRKALSIINDDEPPHEG